MEHVLWTMDEVVQTIAHCVWSMQQSFVGNGSKLRSMLRLQPFLRWPIFTLYLIFLNERLYLSFLGQNVQCMLQADGIKAAIKKMAPDEMFAHYVKATDERAAQEKGSKRPISDTKGKIEDRHSYDLPVTIYFNGRRHVQCPTKHIGNCCVNVESSIEPVVLALEHMLWVMV